MKKYFLPALILAVLAAGCSSSHTSLFRKKTPFENYEETLHSSGQSTTPEGQQWISVSKAALQFPASVQLPFRLLGAFNPQKPQALGLRFTAKQGERLHFTVAKKDSADFILYAELYERKATGDLKLVQAIDTNVADFACTVAETGDYVLKLQPELFRTGTYSLNVSVGPSLRFPAADKKAYIGSTWGDDRDGGKRSHEGVDIFAPKGSPAVAAIEGVIVAVREGGIGGKTVWLRPNGQSFNLYYAHLDKQLVQEGQSVNTGDTLGLVGNTGNAKYTPSHLHFGVYGESGAMDPSPFVAKQVKMAAPLNRKLPSSVRLTKTLDDDSTVKKDAVIMPLAVMDKGYLFQTYEGRIVGISFSQAAEAMPSDKRNQKPVKKSTGATKKQTGVTP